ncbi:MAG TPA: hypothetical protein VNR65_05340 [Geobacterales bacterium]|jgi:hypothetical protein|nr:hypothetical protein [Geobacterales bacterium]
MADFKKSAGLILLGLMAAVLSAIGPVAAKDVALTQDNVSRFLASFAEMRAIAMIEGVRTGMDAETSKNPVGVIVKAIKSSKLQAQAQGIAVKHGFADIREWSDTGRAIGQAYLYVTAGPARGIARETLNKNKDTAIKELEKLGLLNDKQKERLRENLDDLSDQLAREPPPQNVAVVGEMKPDIEATVKLGLN